MKFQISKTDVGADVLLLGVFTSELESGAFSLENRGQNGTLLHKAHLDEFTGSVGQTSHHVPNPERGVARIVSFGLGSRADFTLDTLRDSLTAAFKEAKRVRAKVIAFELPPLDAGRPAAIGLCPRTPCATDSHARTKGAHGRRAGGA